jgi:hypothetical protein
LRNFLVLNILHIMIAPNNESFFLNFNFFFLETESHCVAQADLELTVLLPQPPHAEITDLHQHVWHEMVLEIQKAGRENIFLKTSSFYTTISNINTCLKTHMKYQLCLVQKTL